MKKMLFFGNLSPRHVERIREVAPDWELIYGKEEEIWKRHLATAEIWGGWRNEAKEALLNGEANPKWIHLFSAGVNRFPLQLLRERDMTLTNSSGVHAYPISETVLAMMLSWTRQLHTYIRRQSEGVWDPRGHLGEMHERTIGIIGVGAIGSEIARLAQAFRMKVLGLRRSGGDLPYVDKMYTYEGLDEMLPECDYVVNTLPLTEETKHMFGKRQFAQMKETAFYVNIGRGQTVDTAALIEALQERLIAGAGLDVVDPEPLPADHPLWKLDNVILTPHTSGGTQYYTERVMDIFIPNLRRFVNGQKPDRNVVDPDRGY